MYMQTRCFGVDVKSRNTLMGLLFVLLLVAVGSLGAFAAGSQPYAGQKIVFLVSPTPTVNKLIDMIPDFEQETGISVTVESIGYDDMMTKEILDLKTKQGSYDVFWLEAPYIEKYEQLGGLLPLGQLAEKAGVDLSDFPSKILDNFSYDGHLYGLPFEGALMVMAYRKDLLDQKGLLPPRSWEEFGGYMDTVKALHNPPAVYGTSIMGARDEALFYEYLNFLWGFGGNLFDAQMHPVINSSQAVQALEFLQSLVPYAPPGTLSYTWTESATAFQQGNVGIEAIFSDWTADLRDPESSKVVGKWGYAPFPGNGPTAFGGYSWAVNAYSSHKDAAFEFAKWATGKDVQLKLAEIGSTPTRLSILNDPALIARFPYLKAYAEAALRAQPPMKIAAYFELYDSLSLRLNQVLSGLKAPREALDLAEQEWTTIMAKYGY